MNIVIGLFPRSLYCCLSGNSTFPYSLSTTFTFVMTVTHCASQAPQVSPTRCPTVFPSVWRVFPPRLTHAFPFADSLFPTFHYKSEGFIHMLLHLFIFEQVVVGEKLLTSLVIFLTNRKKLLHLISFHRHSLLRFLNLKRASIRRLSSSLVFPLLFPSLIISPSSECVCIMEYAVQQYRHRHKCHNHL